MILLSQIAFRRRLSPEEVKALKFKVPGGVVTTVIGLLFLAFIIALIGYHPDTRISLYVGMAWIALLLLGWVFKTRRERRSAGSVIDIAPVSIARPGRLAVPRPPRYPPQKVLR